MQHPAIVRAEALLAEAIEANTATALKVSELSQVAQEVKDLETWITKDEAAAILEITPKTFSNNYSKKIPSRPRRDGHTDTRKEYQLFTIKALANHKYHRITQLITKTGITDTVNPDPTHNTQ